MIVNRPLLLTLGAIGLGTAAAPLSFALAAPIAHLAQNAVLRVQTFSVAKMTCATCPIAVKTAMQRVPGVRSVKIDFETKKATVTFDPTRTDAAAIAAASTNAGYPAKLAA
jgi:mercuric ion binding protein